MTKYEYEVGAINAKEVLSRYRKWKNHPVYIGVFTEGDDCLRFFRGKKRGDKKYVNSITQKVVTSIRHFAKEYDDWRLWKFITLTTKVSGKRSYHVVRKAWNRLLTHLKYYAKKQGRSIKTLRVFEFQKRGSVHIHVILHGLLFIPKQKLLRMWGVGWSDIRACRHIGQLVGYVTKYLKKSVTNDQVTKWFWIWRARQWSMSFPIRLDSKSLSQKIPVKIWGVGAIWWGNGQPIELRTFIKHGYKGLCYWIRTFDYEMIAGLLGSILVEMKRNST